MDDFFHYTKLKARDSLLDPGIIVTPAKNKLFPFSMLVFNELPDLFDPAGCLQDSTTSYSRVISVENDGCVVKGTTTVEQGHRDDGVGVIMKWISWCCHLEMPSNADSRCVGGIMTNCDGVKLDVLS